MNWIIRSNKRMLYHTYLDLILEPIKHQIDGYNWIVSDIEMYSNIVTDPPIDMETDYNILSPSEFKRLVDCKVQFWWGVFLAVPISQEVILNESNMPYSEFNKLVWKNGNIQYPGAEIEIICWDSSCTIVKFSSEILSNKFKAYFDGATPLEKFDYNKLYK